MAASQYCYAKTYWSSSLLLTVLYRVSIPVHTMYDDVRRRCNGARWFLLQRSHTHCVVVRRRTQHKLNLCGILRCIAIVPSDKTVSSILFSICSVMRQRTVTYGAVRRRRLRHGDVRRRMSPSVHFPFVHVRMSTYVAVRSVNRASDTSYIHETTWPRKETHRQTDSKRLHRKLRH